VTFEQNGIFSQGPHRAEQRIGNWFEPVAASRWGEKAERRKGRLEVRRVTDIESLGDTIDRVHEIVINPPLPQLEYISYHSCAALNIGRQYGTPFAASTSTGLSKYVQPAQAEDDRGPASS
jgi:hypothetical protein